MHTLDAYETNNLYHNTLPIAIVCSLFLPLSLHFFPYRWPFLVSLSLSLQLLIWCKFRVCVCVRVRACTWPLCWSVFRGFEGMICVQCSVGHEIGQEIELLPLQGIDYSAFSLGNNTHYFNMYINKQDAQNSCENFVDLVGLYTYCKMMHGAYNIKRIISVQKVASLHTHITNETMMMFSWGWMSGLSSES